LPRFFVLLCQVIVPLSLLSACADFAKTTTPSASVQGVNDPWEEVNRVTLDHNDFFDRLLVRPLAELYRATIPPGVRDCVAGIIGNMREPVILANDLLQGDFDKAGITAELFGINSTIGLGGMCDVAGGWDLPRQTGDFGQTLASWGVGEGPYLVLPGLGPSDVRDAFGTGVDFIMSPWQYVVLAEDGTTALAHFEGIYIGTDGLIKREQSIETVDTLRKGSMDYYAEIRSAYLQYRRSQLGRTQAVGFYYK